MDELNRTRVNDGDENNLDSTRQVANGIKTPNPTTADGRIRKKMSYEKKPQDCSSTSALGGAFESVAKNTEGLG